MVITGLIIGLFFLILLSIIDVKTYDQKKGYIPAILTTLFLIVSFIWAGPEGLYTGILAGLMGLLLTDLDFWAGLADFKVYIATAMLFKTFLLMLLFTGFLTILALIFKWAYLRINKNPKAKMPFIPVILLSFIVGYAFLN